jgi:DNA/RNA-binding domain of Phe-tRNA-synthetase-like protein
MDSRFLVAPEVFERFPDYIVGWVLARNVATDQASEITDRLLSEAEQRARLLYADKDLKEERSIAVWRNTFTTLGWSASKYPSSVEAIVKRVARGADLPRINPAVDLANAAVLTYLTPIGCHDLDRSIGLSVRLAVNGDRFLPMGDAPEEEPPAGEIVYAAGASIRTRRWVWRQSRDALVGPENTTLLFPVDGFADITLSRVEAATEFVANMCRTHLGADVTHGLISRDQPAVRE